MLSAHCSAHRVLRIKKLDTRVTDFRVEPDNSFLAGLLLVMSTLARASQDVGSGRGHSNEK